MTLWWLVPFSCRTGHIFFLGKKATLLGSRLALGVGPTLDVEANDSGGSPIWQACPRLRNNM